MEDKLKQVDDYVIIFKWLCAITAGMDYLTIKGVIHRDLRKGVLCRISLSFFSFDVTLGIELRMF